MAKEQSYYDITFNVKGDGQVTAKIEGMYTQFRSLETILKKINQIESKRESTRTGTVNYYNQQIKLIQQERDAFANTTKAYKDATQAMDKLAMMRDKLTGAEREAKAPMAGTVAAYRQQITELRSLQQTLAKTPEKYKEFEDQINNVKTNLNALTGSIRMSRKPNQDMISNAGLAGATLTELGRTISDLPYGIRGVANNLSQLSTLFVTLISKTEGGMIPALKGLWKQLNGPLGIVLAFQVAISALDYFAGAQDKAKGKTSDLSEELKEQSTVLKELMRLYIASNDVIEKREGILRAIKQIDKDLYEALKEGNKTEKERLKIVESRNTLIDAEVKAGKNRNKINEEQADLTDRLSKLENDRASAKEHLKKLEESEILNAESIARVKKQIQIYDSNEIKINERKAELNLELIGVLSNLTQAEENYAEALGKTNEKSRDYLNSIEELNTSLIQKQIERIEAEEAVDQEGAEKKVGRVAKLQEKLLDIELKARLREANERGASIFEISQIEAYYQLEREILERETNDELISIKREYFGESHDDLVNYYGTTIEEDDKAAKKRLALAKWAQSELAKSGEAGVADFLSNFEGSDDPKSKKKKEKTPEQEREELVKQATKLVDSLQDVFSAQFDAEISREERKTVLMNNQLKERLKNENLSAKEKENINKQIAANEEALQKKRDQLAEKNFKIQKAVQIAQTLMSTYEMAADAFGTIKGMKILGPAALPIAIAAAGTATAFGLAQVDAIRRQQFVPSGVGSGGGSSSSSAATSIQAPDFNIVGASGASQLAQAVSGQLDKPVKAYIVAKDVSTAQEMDRNKIEAASL